MARILIIEDNPANLELMVYLLKAFSHTPLEARDGREGLDVARREKPDLILCDIQLPDIDGYDIVRQIKTDPDLRSIPLVAVTAYAMVGDRDKVLGAGFNDYLTKPIAPESFVQRVEGFLNSDKRSAPAQIHATNHTTTPSRLDRATILVVDDSPANLELVRSILEPSGYRVQTVSGVGQALALAQQSPPDLIVSDLHMPGQDGFDLLRVLKADPLLKPIPVIIHSATVASSKDQTEALGLGANRFITQPLEPELLLSEIEICLRK